MGGSAELNEERLRRLLEMGSSVAGNPRGHLERLGVALPSEIPEDQVAAVVNRLLEAEREEEDEIFTGVRIVQDGQVAPGMAAIVRSGRGAGHFHAFIYDMSSIQRWQQEHGSDPNTRDQLFTTDIVPLMPTSNLPPHPHHCSPTMSPQTTLVSTPVPVLGSMHTAHLQFQPHGRLLQQPQQLLHPQLQPVPNMSMQAGVANRAWRVGSPH